MSSKNKDKNNQNNQYNYNKDSIFDKFDITELVKNDLLIPKAPIENFFYVKEMKNIIKDSNNNQNLKISSSSPEEKLEKIISKINDNNFGIHIDELVITFPNDYKMSFIDLYTPIELIGQGGFGIVLSVIDKKNCKKIAVKIISKSSHKEDFYLIEAELLQKLNHEKILKFYDVINTEDYLFIFTDLCEGGSLKDFIISRYNNKNNYLIKDSECATIIKNLLQGIEYLSQNGVIHRDLKPENIMFKTKDDLNSLVICDLGIAGELKNLYSFMDCKCGTLIFMAPEIIMERQYDNLVDIWSAGIIMYILESGGSHPLLYNSKKKSEFIEDIKSKKKFYFPDFFPIIARNIFLKMCKYEPCFRYDANKSLNHPWITRQNKNIPLTVFDNLEKEEKIRNMKEMLVSMIFIRLFKKILNIRLIQTENRSEFDLVKRKLNIRKGNINYELYPSPYNYFCSGKRRKKSNSIRELPVLTRPNSKKDINNLNINTSTRGIFKLKSFNNTSLKKSVRYSIYSKNISNTNSKKNNKSNTLQMANLRTNKTLVKSKIKIEKIINNNNKIKFPSILHDSLNENISNQLKSPNLANRVISKNFDSNRYLTARMIKNKENLNINYLNSINNNVINNYSNLKNNNNFKTISKANLIEPRNLFHKQNNNVLLLKNNGSDLNKKNF